MGIVIDFYDVIFASFGGEISKNLSPTNTLPSNPLSLDLN